MMKKLPVITTTSLYKLLLLLSFACLSTNTSLQAQQCGTWTSIANMSRSSQDTQSLTFSIGNKAYLCKISDGFPYFLEYTPETNTWVQKTPFPGYARANGVAFAANGKGYIALGSRFYTYLQDVWEYDPTTNAWTRKADFPGQGRNHARSFTIGNTAYVGTGSTYDKAFTFNDLWKYNSKEDLWVKVADLPGEARSEAVAFAVNNKGYIALGETSTSSLQDVWEYAPATNTWTQKNDFGGGALIKTAGFTVNAKGYICGGLNTTTNTASKKLWEYNATTDTWKTLNDYVGIARVSPRSFVVGDVAYVGLGSSTDYPRVNFWAYTPCNSKGGRFSASTNPTGKANTPEQIEVLLHPNPAQGKVHLQLRAHNQASQVTATVLNLKGAVVMQTTSELYAFSIDLSQQPQGIYLVKVTTDKGDQIVKRVVLQ